MSLPILSSEVWQNSIAARFVGTCTLDTLQADADSFFHTVDNDLATVEPFPIQRMFANDNMELLFGFKNVTTHQCFSEHIFEFDCDNCNSSDDAEPIGVPLYTAIKEVGAQAVENNVRLSGTDRWKKQAIQWLEKNELAQNGLLLPEAVSAQTCLRAPLAMPGSTFDTAFGIRQRHVQNGWELKTGRAARASARTMNQSQCYLYYKLLQDHLDDILVYEESGCFSHSQQVHYYQTVLCAFNTTKPSGDLDDSVWNIPLSMSVDFYSQLQLFIKGSQGQDDPRKHVKMVSLSKKRSCNEGTAEPRRVKGRGKGRGKGRSRGHVTPPQDLEIVSIGDSGEEETVPKLPSTIVSNLQRCHAVDTAVAAEGATSEMDTDDHAEPEHEEPGEPQEPALVFAPHVNHESNHDAHQRADIIAAAVKEMEPIARSHHKATHTADVIIKVLPQLCEAILDGMSLSPADRVEQAMKRIEANGHRFWGAGDVYARRRTARDCLLLVYHDVACRLLT